MSLSEYIYSDMSWWVYDLFDIMDSELSEEYEIHITGHEYHRIMLESAMGRSSYCKHIKFSPVEHKIPISEKYSFACQVNEKYSVLSRTPRACIALSCENVAEFEGLGLEDVEFTKEASDYAIAKEGQTPRGSYKYCIFISERNFTERSGGVSYLHVTKESLAAVIDYLNTYQLRIETIKEIFDMMSKRQLEDEARLEFEAFSLEEYRVHMSGLPDVLESGKSYPVKLKVFPKCLPDPGVVINVSDSNVLYYAKGESTAGDECQAKIFVRDKIGNEYCSFEVRVIKHNYVSNITLVLPATEVDVGESMVFKTILTPMEAEDADEVKYTVSDESVAVMTGKNELYALAPGRFCLTVSTSRVCKRAFISVIPRLTGISLPAENLRMQLNCDAILECVPVPANASPAPQVTWSCSNESVVTVAPTSAYGVTIKARGFGTAVVTCSVKGTGIKKQIKISVPKSGCYVATAVYGSYDCPQVWVLRRYRDEYLAKRRLGRLFIKAYYATSPKAVAMFGKTKWFNKLWRKILDKKVRSLEEKGFDNKPYYGD
jgi:hypothetical protein